MTLQSLDGRRHWSNVVDGIKFGNDPSEAWGMEPMLAITDSGNSYVTISERYWDWFIEHLASFAPSGFTSYNDSLKKLVNCSDLSQLPAVSVLFGSHFFEILPTDYVLDYSSVGVGCLVMFVEDSED